MSRLTLQAGKKNERSLLPVPVRLAFAVAGRVAPEATAGLAARLFLRTRRHRPPGRELEALAGARAVPLPVDGAQLATWVWGDAPRVLLVHGWEGRASQMGAFALALRAAGLGAVAVDAPGHGASPGSRSTLVAMAAALRAAEARFGRFLGVIAHSAGAVATSRALADGLGADRAVFVAPGSDMASYARALVAEAGLGGDFGARFRRRVEGEVGVPWEAIEPYRLAPAMTTPLLVVHDRDDREAPLAGAEELVRRWPAAELVRTRGLGHRRILRQPEVVARAVEFLAPSPRPATFAAEAAPCAS